MVSSPDSPDKRSSSRAPVPDAGAPEVCIIRTDRHSVELEAKMNDQQGPSTVTLLDLSVEGFKAAARGKYEVGSYVMVQLPNSGWRVAEVRWATAEEFGAEFRKPLKPKRSAGPRRSKPFGRSRPNTD